MIVNLLDLDPGFCREDRISGGVTETAPWSEGWKFGF
jgi:hypothetical protein